MSYSNSSLPKVSFVIPTLNSEKTIKACLDSIVNQNYPSIEIVIVDGGSKDDTLKIASQYIPIVKILKRPGFPLGYTRQVGASYAEGDIIGIFDSDIILPSPQWLHEAVSHFLKNRKLGVLWPINKAPPTSTVITKCYLNMWLFFLEERAKEGKSLLPGGNTLILREAFDKARGFNVKLHFGEDMDLIYRILSSGYKFILFKEPILHNTMRSVSEFFTKQIKGALTIIRGRKLKQNIDLLSMCMAWQPSFYNSSLTKIVLEALIEHIAVGIKGMVKGLKMGDKSWIVFPLLMLLRVIAYGTIFLLFQIKILK